MWRERGVWSNKLLWWGIFFATMLNVMHDVRRNGNENGFMCPRLALHRICPMASTYHVSRDVCLCNNNNNINNNISQSYSYIPSFLKTYRLNRATITSGDDR